MQKQIQNPELFVLGAGPGDPDLMTIKGFKVLQQANVILYDNLANKELLAISRDDCEKVYVGKQPYGDYTPQETIHELIKHYAFTKGNVVRLKGGDPFIFGRGFEEIIYAREHGITTHYIPGVTSMQASGLEDIPLTHRQVSESVWMVTGTKKDGSLSADLTCAIHSNATVVIYMGMKKLAEIASAYIKAGKGDTPAAIIQHASLPQQKSAKGKVSDLEAIAADNQLTYPAIIIIGDVVNVKN
ncbi:uroporphyrinogen-III C-methyltransferase [Mucilaginibacter gossypii]|uniref:uroporphyrinogen-III C-methyltransferase n=1 Tax=Mucilaginibacter gossypii TaxID=551996 RepID=UPI000DCD8C3F|nr:MULTISPECIES: uroporphyrinogen-III C-methyltransferase [Mucilaginibacter]QTE38791.1 uroporphyrinogen-III C-methyltransferase [Mucilaginibacter gossypii]RAV55133.1 uroporphyrinogen-III C-methyltransferase [Mucilaginibacter rubeus]